MAVAHAQDGGSRVDFGRATAFFSKHRSGRRLGMSVVALALFSAATVIRPAAAAIVEISDLYGTGAATQTSLVANGSTDPHYQVTVFQPDTSVSGTQNPYGVYPPADPSIFTGTPSAYSIDPFQALSPNVTSGSRVSQWITPPGSFTSTGTPFTPAGQNVIAPVGRYTFETTFTLPSSFAEITKIFISGSVAGDNVTPNVFLNGTPVPGFTGGGPFSYETTAPLSSLFVTGTNTLRFRLNNIFNTPEKSDFYNPAGLHVNITGAYYETSPTVIPEIDPASFSAVFSIVFGSLAVAERRMRRRRA
ncbi:MAG: hypothetical protein KGQ61_12595 [Planctomycetes bacterium]|nr:hypothetical protein [Planctomycetota bacterium]